MELLWNWTYSLFEFLRMRRRGRGTFRRTRQARPRNVFGEKLIEASCRFGSRIDECTCRQEKKTSPAICLDLRHHYSRLDPSLRLLVIACICMSDIAVHTRWLKRRSVVDASKPGNTELGVSGSSHASASSTTEATRDVNIRPTAIDFDCVARLQDLHGLYEYETSARRNLH